MIWFFLSLVLFVGVFSSALILEKIEFAFYWNKGLVPPWKRDKEEARIHIYISLAALLLKKGQQIEKHPQREALYKFILRNKSGRFPIAERDSYLNKIRNMFAYAVKHPIQLESAATWIMHYNFPLQKRLQIVRFLADFASVGGKIDQPQMEIISRFSASVSISETQLKEMIEKLKEEKAQENSQKRKQHTTGPKITEFARYCAILGVSQKAELKEIKRAYRKLAQASHPDRFVNASQSEYDAAHQRFLEIQHSYETLEKMLSPKS